MLNGLGLMMVALRVGQKNSKFAVVPISLFTAGTFLFSGIIFYSNLQNDRTFNKFIRFGGSATIFGWFAMAFI